MSGHKAIGVSVAAFFVLLFFTAGASFIEAAETSDATGGADIGGPLVIWFVQFLISGASGFLEGKFFKSHVPDILIRWVVVAVTIGFVTPLVYAQAEHGFDYLRSDLALFIPVELVTVLGGASVGYVVSRYLALPATRSS